MAANPKNTVHALYHLPFHTEGTIDWAIYVALHIGTSALKSVDLLRPIQEHFLVNRTIESNKPADLKGQLMD